MDVKWMYRTSALAGAQDQPLARDPGPSTVGIVCRDFEAGSSSQEYRVQPNVVTRNLIVQVGELSR
jgi:hypothetical protein